jgi:hypothetical protein
LDLSVEIPFAQFCAKGTGGYPLTHKVIECHRLGKEINLLQAPAAAAAGGAWGAVTTAHSAALDHHVARCPWVEQQQCPGGFCTVGGAAATAACCHFGCHNSLRIYACTPCQSLLHHAAAAAAIAATAAATAATAATNAPIPLLLASNVHMAVRVG